MNESGRPHGQSSWWKHWINSIVHTHTNTNHNDNCPIFPVNGHDHELLRGCSVVDGRVYHISSLQWMKLIFFLVLSNSFHRFDIKPRDPFVNCNAKHVSDSHNNKKWRKLNDPKSKSINYDDDNSVIRSFLFFLKLHNHFKQIFPFELCVIYIFFGQKQMWLVRWWFWFISKKNEMKKKIWMKSKSFLKGHKPLTKKKITAWT